MKCLLIHPEAKLPFRATANAAGYDACAVEFTAIPCGCYQRVRLGIALEVPAGYEVQIRPRSGLAKRGIVALLGTVDADYRGEVSALLFNHSPDTFHVRPGDRICQLVPAKLADLPEITQAESLTPTERGANGWGSTGVETQTT